MFFRSFRARLSWFFVVIVILPIVMVTVVLLRLVSDSEAGKVDARLAQAQTSASELYRTREGDAAAAARHIAATPGLAAADPAAFLDAQRTTRKLAYVGLELTGGRRVESGDARAVAPAKVVLNGVGTLTVAVTTPQAFADDVHDLTDLDAVIAPSSGPPAATVAAAGTPGRRFPRAGEVTLGKEDFRVSSFKAGATQITLLADRSAGSGAADDDRRTVILLLVAFVLLAFLFAAAVSRSLQAQIARLLHAARRLGRGDLDAEVPTEGDDEFAALGNEFNAMARQLKGRMGELESERERLQTAIRRVGESIATGSDRSRVLDIVMQTAVDGTGAGAGRASVRQAPGGPLERRAAVGEADGFAAILGQAEDEVLERREPAVVNGGDAHALAVPLRQQEGGSKVVGLMSLARRGRAFSPADHELVGYLATQAAVSIEHVDAAETVQRLAVTDGLTGLFNHRRFQEAMAIEVERSKRFQHPLGLVMLDLDDFKDVNDRFGHLQGDQVLREVARVLLDTSREIDEPARYGGEEMAVVLPQTDLDGAMEFAERLRGRIEDLEVPVLQGEGSVRITASVGAAALPQSSVADKDALVQAADSALYRAKRLGKNRVVRAG